MKLRITLLLIIFISLNPCHVVASSTEIPMGIYEYVYKNNFKDLIENHYIKLFIKNNNIYGEYYGTSDDFDEAREGYLPGFFSAKMMNVQIKGAEISFSIKPSKYFKNPITPINKVTNNSPWDITIELYKRRYQGIYRDNKLMIQTNGIEPRIFTKIE